ncbi:15274_t:CDS:2 [Cetraspora pellucida]|uniref:15274_t:CDS:1 n=1 Tax=Cetraspora pellucida TaxID=1433469 RepID=A0A9N9BPL6_9GLOM|nr:15274_t:CDS:2 [Cetraspora pellucida]
MASEPALLTAIHFLQNPIPQYVLGTLPAIAITGTNPENSLSDKLYRLLQCLSCPFIGLFYFCNVVSKDAGSKEVESTKVQMSAYWLEKDEHSLEKEYFIHNQNDSSSAQGSASNDDQPSIQTEDSSNAQESTSNKDQISGDSVKISVQSNYLITFGYYKMKLNSEQKAKLENWVANASLLDRLASLVSAYYILVGIFVGISKAAGPCMEDNSLEDWPFIPLLFIWTLPIIYVRIRRGKVVYKLSKNDENYFETHPIHVTALKGKDRNNKRIYVAITALFSVTTPWLAVIIAYYTPPIGFFCRIMAFGQVSEII